MTTIRESAIKRTNLLLGALLTLLVAVTGVQIITAPSSEAAGLGGYVSRHYGGSDVTYLTIDCGNPNKNMKIPRGKSSTDIGCRDVDRIYVNTGCTAPLSVGKGPYWFTMGKYMSLGVGLSC